MQSEISLAAMILANEARHSDVLAYIDGPRTLTHGALARRARQLASALHQHGCQHQDRVAILSQNRLEYGELYAASHLSGLIAATVNFRLAAPEVLATVKDSAPRVFVFEAQYASLVDGIRAAIPTLAAFVCLDAALDWAQDYEDFLASGDPDGPPFEGSGDDIASIIYTSGSTGKPKGCIMGQREFARLAQMIAGGMRMSERDRTVLPMPMFHVGAKSLQAATHWRGATVVILREFRPENYLRTLQDFRITKGHLAPTMIQMLLEIPDVTRFDLSSVSLIMYSASAMPVPVLRRAIALFGNVFQNSYGMSEGPATLLEPEQHDPDGDAAAQQRLQSIGVPYPGVEAMIMAEDGSPVPVGQPGEICVRSDAMFRGYWNNSVATIEAMRGGWYRSGDIGKTDENGYFYLVDRKKDMIISGGENIYSREVEDALLTHPGVLEVAVIGIPHEIWGETVCAVIVRRAGFTPTEPEIVAHSRERIASYKKPQTVVFVEELPKFASGKINKPELRTTYAALPAVRAGTTESGPNAL